MRTTTRRRGNGPHGEGGGDVEEVVVGQNEDAAAIGDAGRFQHVAAAAIAVHKAGAAEAGVVEPADIVHDDDGQAGPPQGFQNARTHAAETAQDDRTLHDDSGKAACFGASGWIR